MLKFRNSGKKAKCTRNIYWSERPQLPVKVVEEFQEYIVEKLGYLPK